MTCQEALALLYDVIDNEAATIDVQEVKEHLSHCKDCAEVYRVEKALDKLMKARIKGDAPATETHALKQSVLKALDALDSGHTCSLEKKSADPSFLTDGHRATTQTQGHQPVDIRPEARPFAIGRILAIAASLVIVVGAAYYASEVFGHREIYTPLEAVHMEAEEHLNDFASVEQINSVESQVNIDLGYDIQHNVKGYRMIGARYDQIDGVDVAHFVYANDGMSTGKIVSVFVARVGEIDIPDELEEYKVVRDQIEFYDHNCRGCRLVYHKVGQLVVVTATLDRSVDLLDFVPGRKAA